MGAKRKRRAYDPRGYSVRAIELAGQYNPLRGLPTLATPSAGLKVLRFAKPISVITENIAARAIIALLRIPQLLRRAPTNTNTEMKQGKGPVASTSLVESRSER